MSKEILGLEENLKDRKCDYCDKKAEYHIVKLMMVLFSSGHIKTRFVCHKCKIENKIKKG